jgi:hypothetical protein
MSLEYSFALRISDQNLVCIFPLPMHATFSVQLILLRIQCTQNIFYYTELYKKLLVNFSIQY